MARSTRLYLVTIGLMMFVTASSAEAELLVFECNVTKTWKDGTNLEVKSRIEINQQTMQFVEFHDYGGKKSLLGDRGKVERVEPARVTMRDGPDTKHYIDRTTGEVHAKWRDGQFEENGICKEVN
jgi:hypothetical protein